MCGIDSSKKYLEKYMRRGKKKRRGSGMSVVERIDM
jgi:hypothetical protein